MDTISFNGFEYPAFQAKGNAAQFAIPYAKHVCVGIGYDIGCNKPEWAFPGAIPIDPEIDEQWHANKLPYSKLSQVDYIFSSHCLEHLDDWYGTLLYWHINIKPGGTLFLYLPDFSQEYWRPWNNRKHRSVFTPEILTDAFHALNMKKVFCSQVDLNNSFMIMGEV
jgi:predicted SAM-dependent methyltransferase